MANQTIKLTNNKLVLNVKPDKLSLDLANTSQELDVNISNQQLKINNQSLDLNATVNSLELGLINEKLTLTLSRVGGQGTPGKDNVQILTTDPTDPVEGDFWYNTTSNVLKLYDGTKVDIVSLDSSKFSESYNDLTDKPNIQYTSAIPEVTDTTGGLLTDTQAVQFKTNTDKVSSPVRMYDPALKNYVENEILYHNGAFWIVRNVINIINASYAAFNDALTYDLGNDTLFADAIYRSQINGNAASPISGESGNGWLLLETRYPSDLGSIAGAWERESYTEEEVRALIDSVAHLTKADIDALDVDAGTVDGFSVGKDVPSDADFTNTQLDKADIDALDVDAGTVNGFSVGKAVPANAVFTDTNTQITDSELKSLGYLHSSQIAIEYIEGNESSSYHTQLEMLGNAGVAYNIGTFDSDTSEATIDITVYPITWDGTVDPLSTLEIEVSVGGDTQTFALGTDSAAHHQLTFTNVPVGTELDLNISKSRAGRFVAQFSIALDHSRGTLIKDNVQTVLDNGSRKALDISDSGGVLTYKDKNGNTQTFAGGSGSGTGSNLPNSPTGILEDTEQFYHIRVTNVDGTETTTLVIDKSLADLDESRTYQLEEMVLFNGDIYECISATSAGEDPTDTPAKWLQKTWDASEVNNPRGSTLELFLGTVGTGGSDGGDGSETFELYTHNIYGAYYWFPDRQSGDGEWANAKLNAGQTNKFTLAGTEIT